MVSAHAACALQREDVLSESTIGAIDAVVAAFCEQIRPRPLFKRQPLQKDHAECGTSSREEQRRTKIYQEALGRVAEDHRGAADAFLEKALSFLDGEQEQKADG